jgi:hypothetical protein
VHPQKRVMMLMSVLACALVLLPGTAFAGTVRQGADYSFGYDRNHRVAVCDAERDATRVYSDTRPYGAGGTYRTYDLNGASSGCGRSHYFRSGIYRHTTCEDRRFLPNPCNASYHG